MSAIVLAWQAEPDLQDCVRALLGSQGVQVEVVLVDNGCTTDDVDTLARLPGVTRAGTGDNVGFSAGCNAGVAVSTGEYVVLVNADAVVEPDTLRHLVAELRVPGVGVAGGAVRLRDEPELLNSSGNAVHVLGISWVGGYRQPETRAASTDCAGAMGTCMAMTRAHWDRLGGFDEHYFAYHEDAELSIRTWRLGLRVRNVPDARVLHRYEFSRNPRKYYLVERNRLMFVLTVWGRRSLVLLAPALLALEVAMVLLAARQHWLRDKVEGWRWLWRHRDHLRARRRLLQAERTVPDRTWMRQLTPVIDTPLVEVPARGPVNAAMTAYWTVVRRLV